MKFLFRQYKSGRRTAQESIAEQLGLSRMPVRVALQSPNQEGFNPTAQQAHAGRAPSADRVSHIFRVIAAMMAAEMLSLLIPSEAGDALLIRAQALRSQKTNPANWSVMRC